MLAFLFFLATLWALLPLLSLVSEVPLPLDLLLVLESFLSNVRPCAPLVCPRGLTGCAFCTALLLELGAT